jgi:hypothetical protein
MVLKNSGYQEQNCGEAKAKKGKEKNRGLGFLTLESWNWLHGYRSHVQGLINNYAFAFHGNAGPMTMGLGFSFSQFFHKIM